MSSAADRAREKATRLAAATRQRPEEAAAEATPAVAAADAYPPPPPRNGSQTTLPRASRVKPVRMTLDMAPVLHADLEDWTTKVSRQLGRGRVVRADVLRVLVRQLLDDPETQERVKEALRRQAD
jgi:hypothetical protein